MMKHPDLGDKNLGEFHEGRVAADGLSPRAPLGVAHVHARHVKLVEHRLALLTVFPLEVVVVQVTS